MIFSCLRQPRESNQIKELLGNHISTPHWNIYYDKGWSKSSSGISKGTCHINFNNDLDFTFEATRNFPLYYNDYAVSNFDKNIGESLPIDAVLKDDGKKFSVSYVDKFYTIDNQVGNLEESVDLVKKCIIENLQKIDRNKQNWLPDHGGIDTLTIRSALDFLKIPYQLFDFKNKLPHRTGLCMDLLKYHWGFNQIPEYNGNVLTGFYGDEFVLRNPYYMHILLCLRDIDITEVFNARPRCYMYKYFNNYREKCRLRSDKDLDQLKQMIMNDFQVWDLNSTTFISPFRDSRLLALLNADYDTIISQVTDAAINKKIIADLNPALLDKVDNFKNQNDPYWFD
jgi:hypothetical protein